MFFIGTPKTKICIFLEQIEKVFALKPKSIQAIQKAIEGFITPIVEQLKIIEPLYELLVRRFGNIKNFIENLKEDSTLLGEIL